MENYGGIIVADACIFAGSGYPESGKTVSLDWRQIAFIGGRRLRFQFSEWVEI